MVTEARCLTDNFFISKQFLVKNLHDQDQIWWKVWNFSSETFLENVDLSKIVNLAWTVLTLAWTYQKQIDLLSHDLFFFGDILRKEWLDCLLNYKKNLSQDWQCKIYWSSGVNRPWLARNGLNLNLIMAWYVRSVMIFSGRPPIPSMHIGIIFQRLLRILLVIRFQDQDHIWWKDLTFSSGMFLEIGYWSKVFDWQFFLSQNNFLYKVFMIKIISDEKFQTFLRRRS